MRSLRYKQIEQFPRPYSCKVAELDVNTARAILELTVNTPVVLPQIIMGCGHLLGRSMIVFNGEGTHLGLECNQNSHVKFKKAILIAPLMCLPIL